MVFVFSLSNLKQLNKILIRNHLKNTPFVYTKQNMHYGITHKRKRLSQFSSIIFLSKRGFAMHLFHRKYHRHCYIINEKWHIKIFGKNIFSFFIYLQNIKKEIPFSFVIDIHKMSRVKFVFFFPFSIPLLFFISPKWEWNIRGGLDETDFNVTLKLYGNDIFL